MYLGKPDIKITTRVLKIRVNVTKETHSGLQILYLCLSVLLLIDFSILMHKTLKKISPNQEYLTQEKNESQYPIF